MRGLKKNTQDWETIFNLFIADRSATCRPRTLVFYRQMWGYWQNYAGKQEPTKELCQGFLQHVAQSYNPNGTRSVWSGVRAVFNFAYTEGLSPFDPSIVKQPKPLKTQKEPLTDAECRQLLKACQNPRDKAIVSLLLDTGLRSAELCSLRMSETNLEQREVFVSNGKGGKQRTVPFSGATLRILRYWLQVREPETPWLFHNVDNNYGTQLHPVYLTRCLSRIGKRAGIVPLGPHRLRHTFGRLYIAGGGDTLHLQRLMGHDTPAMTSRYVKLSRTDLQKGHAAHSPLVRVLFGEERVDLVNQGLRKTAH